MRNLMIAGNWKMNKDLQETIAFAQALKPYATAHNEPGVQMVIAPVYPFIFATEVILKDTCISIAAQDVSANSDGAFTGEVSATMLASMDLPYCLVGHSERRQYHAETDAIVNAKLNKLLENCITPIFCLGEKLEERKSNLTISVLERQLNDGLKDIKMSTGSEIVIAYEPVWAIGTGLVATPEQAQEAHAFIRAWVKEHYGKDVSDTIRILYGGSVKPENIKELLLKSDLDGALIGGASLKLEHYIQMLDIAKEVIHTKE